MMSYKAHHFYVLKSYANYYNFLFKFMLSKSILLVVFINYSFIIFTNDEKILKSFRSKLVFYKSAQQ